MKKRRQVPGMSGAFRRQQSALWETLRSEAHGAGHVTVAHALGTHVVRVRTGEVYLPPGHPENSLPITAILHSPGLA